MSIDEVSIVDDSRDEEALKREFAYELYSGKDPSEIASRLFPDDFAYRMRVSISWPNDPIVVEEFTRLSGGKKAGEDKEIVLPSKERHLEMLYDIFKSNENRVQDRLMASMQISQLRGFVAEKNEGTTINNKVLVITRSSSDEDWEKKVARNQKDLMNGVVKVEALDMGGEVDE